MGLELTATCPYCLGALEQAVTTCPWCGTGHHRDCWDENTGCAVAGCDGTAGAPAPAPAEVVVAAAAAAAGGDLTDLPAVLLTQQGVLGPGQIDGHQVSGCLPPWLARLGAAAHDELAAAVERAAADLAAQNAMGRHGDEIRRLLLLGGEEGYRLGRFLLGVHAAPYPGPPVGADALSDRLAVLEARPTGIAAELDPEIDSLVESLACEVGAFESRSLSWMGRKNKRIGFYGALVYTGIEVAVAEHEHHTAGALEAGPAPL